MCVRVCVCVCTYARECMRVSTHVCVSVCERVSLSVCVSEGHPHTGQALCV